MGLTFTQLGLIAFTLNMVSSVMQPAIGWYTDKRPMPYALPIALFSSAVGIFGILVCSVLCHHSALRCLYRTRLCDLPSRGLPCCQHGMVETGSCPVHLSSRREYRSSLCSAYRCINARPARSDRRGLVYDCWNDGGWFPSLYFKMVRR
ncbi:Fosmidomycin resistance protein [Bacillus safensis subsp. safensis]